MKAYKTNSNVHFTPYKLIIEVYSEADEMSLKKILIQYFDSDNNKKLHSAEIARDIYDVITLKSAI